MDNTRSVTGRATGHTARARTRSRAASGTRPGLVLAACCLSQLLVILDSSIMNVALPAVQRALHFDQNSLQWVLNAFMIPFAGFLLLSGRMADLVGRRSFLLTGITLFTVASLVGGLAPHAGVLVAARAGQGLGAAIIAPTTLAVLATTFTQPAERARAFGLWGAAAGSGGAIGVLAGGVIVEWLSWRWVLLVNVPVGILLFAMTGRGVAASQTSRRQWKLDVPGAVSVTVGLAALVYGIAEGGRYGWGSARIVATLATAAVLLAFFVLDQAVLAREPLVPLAIFRNRSVSAANAVMFCAGAALASTFYFMTLLMQQVLGYGPLRTGLAYLPLSLTAFAGAAGIAPVVARLGPRPVLLAGLSSSAVGLLWLSRADDAASYPVHLLGPSLLFGFGLGMVITAAANAATARVPEQQQGLASGLLNTNQAVGGAAGLAALVAVAAARTGDLLPAGRPSAGQVNHALAVGYDRAFLVAAILLIASLLLAVVAVPGGRPATSR